MQVKYVILIMYLEELSKKPNDCSNEECIMKVLKHIVASILLLTCSLMLFGCAFISLSYEARERAHYSDKSNFVTVTAVCINSGYYSYPSEQYCYAIDFKDAVYDRTDNRKFQNVTFRVDKYSAEILKEHDIENKLAPGTIFTCISAPIYLSDSYDCPIVALEINGEILLDFETGYRNLMATYGVKLPK